MPIEDYPHPTLATDIVLFALRESDLWVLLIQRRKPPFEGAWSFPGGFANVGETLEQAALRELEEETGVHIAHLEQLHAFGDPSRDPRGHVVTVVYWGLMPGEATVQVQGGDDAAQARWWPVGDLPPLAFDHRDILDYALRHLGATSAAIAKTPGEAAVLEAYRRTTKEIL
jgi:8-oxo-dGTP diphosphatase